MKKLNIVVPCATAIVLAVSGAANAASTSAGSASNKVGSNNSTGSEASGTSNNTASARDLTCAQLTAFDTATVPGVLYFLRGYDQGQRDSSGSMGGDTASVSGAAPGKVNKSEAAGANSTSADTASNSTDKAGAKDAGNSAGSDNSTAVATSDQKPGDVSTGMASADETASRSDGDAAHTSGSSMDKGNPQIAAIAGYFEIPVQDVILRCQKSPDSRVTDMMGDDASAGSTK